MKNKFARANSCARTTEAASSHTTALSPKTDLLAVSLLHFATFHTFGTAVAAIVSTPFVVVIVVTVAICYVTGSPTSFLRLRRCCLWRCCLRRCFLRLLFSRATCATDVRQIGVHTKLSELVGALETISFRHLHEGGATSACVCACTNDCIFVRIHTCVRLPNATLTQFHIAYHRNSHA